MNITTNDISDIYARILIRECGPDDNFFDIGGDSLLAEALMIEVSKLAKIDLPIVTLLDHPTPNDLALHIASL